MSSGFPLFYSPFARFLWGLSDHLRTVSLFINERARRRIERRQIKELIHADDQ